MRYSDIDKISPRNIINGITLKFIPTKTPKKKKKRHAVQTMNKQLKEILTRYNFDTSSLKISNQKYNERLEIMFDVLRATYSELEYKEKYTSHNGRDTFISLAVEKGTDYKTILGWTGQSSYEILDRYIKTSDEYEKKQMNNLFGLSA